MSISGKSTAAQSAVHRLGLPPLQSEPALQQAEVIGAIKASNSDIVVHGTIAGHDACVRSKIDLSPEFTPRLRNSAHAVVNGLSSAAQSIEQLVGIPTSGHEPGVSQQLRVTGLRAHHSGGKMLARPLARD